MKFRMKSHKLNKNIMLSLVILMAIIIRLYFIFYIERTWEDGLTAVVHADNFWRGIGLTHFKNNGDVIQGFTSPVGVIVPLIGGGLFGVDGVNFGNSLLFLKLISTVSIGMCLYFIYVFINGLKIQNKYPLFLLPMFYVGFEHHQILWGTAGLETSFTVTVVFYYFLSFAKLNYRGMIISMAAILYVRPDLVLLNIIGLIYLLIFCKKDAIKVVYYAFLLYLPWFIFSFYYYGNPIPNTIFAKLYGYSSPEYSFSKFLDAIVPLGPSFAGHGTGYWREWDRGFISIVIFTFFGIGVIDILSKKIREFFLPVGFVLVFHTYYLFFVSGVFGWYLVPLSAVTIFVASYGISICIKSNITSIIFSLLYLFSLFSILPSNFRAEYEIQNLIENKVRKELGLYLGSLINDNEIVAMEPLGYSSYYSNKEIYDYPGLASREVVDFLKINKNIGFCSMIQSMRPKYIALRHYECINNQFITENYSLINEFKVDNNISKIKGIEHNIDLHFMVYKIN